MKGDRVVVDFVNGGCCPYDDIVSIDVTDNGTLVLRWADGGGTLVAHGHWICAEKQVSGEGEE